MTIAVAALYVLARGPYANMPDVDPWPERRNALLYRGPWPVLAHPPCAWWSRSVRHQVKVSSSQGPHLAPTAVTQVQDWCGVLEQPARSILWETMGLPFPEAYRQMTIAGPERDEHGGFTVEVDQSSWHDPESPQEHGEHKRTWLYMVGIQPEDVHLPPVAKSPPKSTVLRTDKRPGSKSSWLRSRYDMMGPESRKRSPVAFARWLVDLAATARRIS